MEGWGACPERAGGPGVEMTDLCDIPMVDGGVGPMVDGGVGPMVDGGVGPMRDDGPGPMMDGGMGHMPLRRSTPGTARPVAPSNSH